MESINSSVKHNSIMKEINYLNYQNIEELQKDIYNNYMELKNNPFYNNKKYKYSSKQKYNLETEKQYFQKN